MKRLLFTIIFVSIFACSNKSDVQDSGDKSTYIPQHFEGPSLILSVLPMESASAMYERFLPLKYNLEDTLKVPVVIKIAKDYNSAIYEIGNGKVHMASLDPGTYCEVRARYKNKVTPLVKAAKKEGSTSRSVLVVKEGSGIEKVVDVRGKRLALGSEQSSFGYLIPLAMLKDVGIKREDLAAVDLLQQEDRIALSVLIGNHDVGAMTESVARKYIKDGLKIIKASESIPQFILCASDALPEGQKKQIIESLTSLKNKNPSSKGGETEGFTTVEDRDFDMIRVMIKNLKGRDYIEYGPKTVKVAILPLYSAITIYDRYEPLMRYLSKKTGYEFKLVIPKNFEDFISIVKSGEVDFSYQNPFVFSIIDREMNMSPLVTTVGEDCASDEGICGEDKFRGVIITRYDSNIKDIGDLKNKRVLIVSPKSAGGYLSQRLFLLERGIDTKKDIQTIDAKRQENVILGVYRGEGDAGFVRESALIVWKEEVDMKKIRILTYTNYLPNWPFASCSNRNPTLVKKIRDILIELGDKHILKSANIKGFKAADEKEFEALKKY